MLWNRQERRDYATRIEIIECIHDEEPGWETLSAFPSEVFPQDAPLDPPYRFI